MFVRHAHPADACSIARVHIDSWKTAYRGLVPDAYLDQLSYDESEQVWRRSLADQNSTRLFVSEVEGAGVVGFAAGGPGRSRDPVDPAYGGELWGIHILAEYRRQGIGQALVREVVRWLAAHGMQSMFVWCLYDAPARLFYTALGGTLLEIKPIEGRCPKIRRVRLARHRCAHVRTATAPVHDPPRRPNFATRDRVGSTSHRHCRTGFGCRDLKGSKEAMAVSSRHLAAGVVIVVDDNVVLVREDGTWGLPEGSPAPPRRACSSFQGISTPTACCGVPTTAGSVERSPALRLVFTGYHQHEDVEVMPVVAARGSGGPSAGQRMVRRPAQCAGRLTVDDGECSAFAPTQGRLRILAIGCTVKGGSAFPATCPRVSVPPAEHRVAGLPLVPGESSPLGAAFQSPFLSP